MAGASVTLSVPCQAQFIEYQAPPPNAYEQPWVGPNTPWTYYNGDWFLNGILYYFFGPQYGWAPYYAYGPSYIVRPNNWYAPIGRRGIAAIPLTGIISGKPIPIGAATG